MKEKKIMTLTQPGYRLQLLKITETTVNEYYQIRENRRIKTTFTTLDAAIKKFYTLIGSKILQKNLFNENDQKLQYNNDTQLLTITGITNGKGWNSVIRLETWQKFISWKAKNE